jgi:hypothetical protein
MGILTSLDGAVVFSVLGMAIITVMAVQLINFLNGGDQPLVEIMDALMKPEHIRQVRIQQMQLQLDEHEQKLIKLQEETEKLKALLAEKYDHPNQ